MTARNSAMTSIHGKRRRMELIARDVPLDRFDGMIPSLRTMGRGVNAKLVASSDGTMIVLRWLVGRSTPKRKKPIPVKECRA